MKVLSLNLRYDNPADGAHCWSRRRAAVGEYLQELSADLVAFQEVLPGQRRDLDRLLPGYRSYGVCRDLKGLDEQCCWYVKDPWWFAEATTFWLSAEPQKVSRGWDAMLPRTCCLARIQGAQGQSFWAANVHLDHAGQRARREGLELVARRLIEKDMPALLVGDFNEPDLWSRGGALADWTDCQSQQGLAHQGTYHGFQGGVGGPRIDAILASAHWKLSHFQLDLRPELSDHYPLWAELEASRA